MSEISSPRPHAELPRNPRRRQRDVDEGASPRQQPQRKRSKVAGDSFKPTSGGHIDGATRNTRLNGSAEGTLASTTQLRIPMREKGGAGKVGKRASKEDGGVLLVCTLPEYNMAIMTNTAIRLKTSTMLFDSCLVYQTFSNWIPIPFVALCCHHRITH